MKVQQNQETHPIVPLVFDSKDQEALMLTILEAIHEKKGNAVVSLDLRNIEEAVADFFIICDVQTGIQMTTVANNIEKKVREILQEKPFQFEMGPTWTLVDYINVVIHIFQENERKFYDLESLWMDATLTEHPDN